MHTHLVFKPLSHCMSRVKSGLCSISVSQIQPGYIRFSQRASRFRVMWLSRSFTNQKILPFYAILLLQINDLQKQVQIKQTEIKDLLNKEIELQDKFQMATSDSRFAYFLRKIYKKKYKLPRVRNADDGKSLKQAVTANLLYTSTHGCCHGCFLRGEVKYVCKCMF